MYKSQFFNKTHYDTKTTEGKIEFLADFALWFADNVNYTQDTGEVEGGLSQCQLLAEEWLHLKD